MSRSRSGRSQETRTDLLRVAVPLTILVAAAYGASGLIHDLLNPPNPHCTVAAIRGSDPCVGIPNLGSALGGRTASPNPSASPSPTPAATPTPGPSGSGVIAASGYISLDGERTIEQGIRVLELLFVLPIGSAAAWFLVRMLTGHAVLWIRPIRRRED